MRQDLAGAWDLKDLESGRKVPTALPGDVYSSLIEAGAVLDPYWGTNENDAQWVRERAFEYARDFEVADELLACRRVDLEIHELDTCGEVRLNGRLVLKTDNMFLRHRAGVRELLRPGRNHIAIRLLPAAREAAKRARRHPYPVPWTRINAVPHMNFVRKVPCHAGWDWGICLMTSGVYGELALVGSANARLDHVSTSQKHRAGRVEVAVRAELDAARAGATEVAFELAGQRIVKKLRLKQGANAAVAVFSIEKPRLWWPAGYGAQPLYDLTVSTGGETVRKRLGLRRLELISEPDKTGRSLIFRVNGVDIFCKGANWIPLDALPARQTPERYRELLADARRVHMNMIRLWGGGQYEKEVFYDTCDELGLLVWHDFMFSCALYPADREFLDSVRREAEYQVKRLRDHACIALWCGDNELVGALTWYEESRKDRDRYLVAYDRLNRTLAAAVREADPTRTFWPSSPCSGPDDFSDAWHDDRRGDMHYWSVWHERKSFDAYHEVRPRFCSEFGYQSFSSKEVVKTFAEPSQWNPTSPVMEHHQRNPAGNSIILEMFSRYFRMPGDFDGFLYLSQVQQALAIKTAVEHWRRWRPHCMGTLYWQLNDNWPVASWSSLEYGGSWKQLHYHARRFYAPAIITAEATKDGSVEVFAVSDATARTELRAEAQLVDLKGCTLRRWRWRAVLPRAGALKLGTLRAGELQGRPEERFLRLSLEARTGRETTRHSNDFFCVPFKRMELPLAQVRAQAVEKQGRFLVRLTTDRPAFFLTLETPGLKGVFSDNSFTLLPGAKIEIEFEPREKTSLGRFRRALALRHLRQNYEQEVVSG